MRVGLFAFLSEQIPSSPVELVQVMCSTLSVSKVLTASRQNHGLLTQPGGPSVNPVEQRVSGHFHEALLLSWHSWGCRARQGEAFSPADLWEQPASCKAGHASDFLVFFMWLILP